MTTLLFFVYMGRLRTHLNPLFQSSKDNRTSGESHKLDVIISVLLLLILMIPAIYAAFTATDLIYSKLKTMAYLLVSLVIILLPSVVLKKRAYFIVEGILVLLPFPIEMASLYLYRMPTTTTLMQVIVDTNLREAGELLASAKALVVVVILIYAVYFFLLTRLRNDYLLPRLLRLTLLCSLPLIFMAGLLFINHLNSSSADRKGEASWRLAMEKTMMKFNKLYPTDIYLNLFYIYKEKQQISEWNKELENFSFDIRATDDTDSLLVCLIIGEAARSQSFSLNNYQRLTNPCLSRRHNIVSFPYAYSQANITEVSVPIMLTSANIRCLNKAYEQRSVVEAMAQAGFTTLWVTNKTPFPYTQRIINTTHHHYISRKSSDAANNYDTSLLPIIDSLISLTHDSPARMMVVHHMGSHFKYNLRYPKEFEQFTPTFNPNEGYSVLSPDNKQKLVNAYDNTILFTDYFIDQTIERIEATHQPAVLFYMSDHGENIYDDERNLVLHCTYAGSDYEFRVPLIVWYSDEYEQRYPEKTKALQQNKECLVSSEALFYSLLDAACLTGSDNDPTLSVMSANFVEPDSVDCRTASGAMLCFRK